MRQDNNFNRSDQIEQRIVLLEDQIRNLTNLVAPFFLKGRLRTDRDTAPMTSLDANPKVDKLYDRIVLPTAEYILIDNAGVLEWRMITLSIF